jgi:hypothetical protein
MMSVDRRLREGLRASADALTPDPVGALRTVERQARRQRRRILAVRLAAATAAIALVLVGLPWFVIQLRGPVAGTPAARSPTATAPGSLLPEGTYRTPELTREQLIAAAVKRGFTRAQAQQALAADRINQTATFTLTIERGQWTQSFNYDRIREGIGFEATYKVIDHSTVLVTEPGGYETVFEYALEGNAIRISFKNADPQQLCQADAKCPMGVIVWESAPFSRV